MSGRIARSIRRTVLCFALLIAAPALALEDVTVQPGSPAPGDILVFEATRKPTRVTFELQPLRFVDWAGRKRAIAGVDLKADPGDAVVLDARWSYAPRVVRRISVQPKEFPRQTLSEPPVAAEPSAADEEQRWKDEQRLDQLWRSKPRAPRWREAFQRPVDGEITAAFGLQRVFDGARRSLHEGVDLGAAIGVPVMAANKGYIVLAEKMSSMGNTVILNHGLGVLTLYGQLAELKVKPGEVVERGAAVGVAGTGGCLAAPGVHWEAHVLRARVDPMQLLRLEPLRE